jgi:exonuclease SbcC
VERAKDLETRAKTRADTIREMLTQPQYAGVTRELVEQRKSEQEALTQEMASTSARVEILSGLAHKVEAVNNVAVRLSELRKEEHMRIEEYAQAQQRAHTAEEEAQRRTQLLAEGEQERDGIGYDARRHEVVQRAAGYLQEHLTASQEAAKKTATLARARQELETLAQRIEVQTQEVEQARRHYEERAETLRLEIADGGDVAALTEKLTTARRWKELRQEQTRLAEQQIQCTRQLSEVRQSLSVLLEQENVKETELRELQQQRDRTRAEAQEKQQQEIEANHLGKDLQEAAREEKRVTQEVEQAQAILLAAERELQRQQEIVLRTEQQEQDALRAVEDDRRKNEIAHIRATLHTGDPCPVCLTPVKDLPSAPQDVQADQSALQQRLEQAKAELSQARQSIRKTEAAVAASRAKKENITQELSIREHRRREAQDNFVTRFPGFSSLGVALTTLRTQQQEIATLLKGLETQTQAVEKEKQALVRQREDVQRSEATLTEALRSTASSLAAGETQLAAMEAALVSYCIAEKDPEEEIASRRQRLIQADQQVKALEAALRRAEASLNTLHTQKLQTEGTGGVLQSECNAAIAQAERAARTVRENLDLSPETPLPTLAALESELSELKHKQERYTACVQRLESLQKEQREAERSIAALHADLQAREGFLLKTRQAIGGANEELEQARTDLRTAIQTCAIPGLHPDGEDVKTQLAVVHEQGIALRERRSRLEAEMSELERRCEEKEQEEQKLREADTESRLAADLRKLLGAEFTDYLSEGAIKALMHDASVHLQKLTHGRYSFRIEYKRRTIELLIVDHEDQQRTRPTHSLSGGETFLASLAIALALSQSFREIATGKAAKTSTECLILDEGFGTLDREGLQLVTETLQELRGEEGRVVGIITHVEEVAAAMPMRIEVRKGSRSSTIAVSG